MGTYRVIKGAEQTAFAAARGGGALPPSPESTSLAHATLTIMTGLDAGRRFVIPRDGFTIGRCREAELRADDPGVSAKHARVGITRDGAYFIEDLGSTNGTFVGASRVECAALSSGDRLQLGPVFRLRFALTPVEGLSLQRGRYEMRDSLTRAFNRGYFLKRLPVEIMRTQRTRGSVAILIFDLDHFKALNDAYGHLAGDRALLAVAEAISRALRSEDIFARYGGETFIVLARETSHADAIRLAERVRRSIAALRFSARSTRISVTVSVGVASLCELVDPPGSARNLVALADSRLDAAKTAGHDRICAHN